MISLPFLDTIVEIGGKLLEKVAVDVSTELVTGIKDSITSVSDNYSKRRASGFNTFDSAAGCIEESTDYCYAKMAGYKPKVMVPAITYENEKYLRVRD